MSYPIYVSHLLVFTVANSFYPMAAGTRAPVLAVCTVIAAVALHEAVAKPVERYRQSRLSRRSQGL